MKHMKSCPEAAQRNIIIFIVIITQTLTSSSCVHLEKLIVTHLAKKIPAIYVTQRLITVFTRGHRCALS
jgi:hypothetical protein